MLDQVSRLRDVSNLEVARIEVSRDLETDHWWASSEDVPGLVSEAETLERLYDRVAEVVPELLRLNGFEGPGVRLEFVAVRQILVG